MTRIGIFGGSFDPPHRAHLEIAIRATEQMPLDTLYFVPSYRSPLKQMPAVAPAHHRMAMTQLLAGLRSEWRVLSYEIDKGRAVPTIETVDDLKRHHPQASCYLIMGGDQAGQFTTWHEWRRLAELVHIVCFTRAGAPPVVPFTADLTIIPYYAQLASTMVRGQIGRGESTGDSLAPVVRDYIEEHSLYQ